MHRYIPLLLALLAFQAPAQPVEFTRSTATLVAWNLNGFNPISRSRIPDFFPTIRDLDPEILALVEVNPDWVAAEIVAELNELGVCYQRKILDQTAMQNIAVLHKCNVRVTNPRLIAGSDNGNSFLRKALVVDVKIGQFDFILVTVHMKAGRGLTNRRVRDNQAQAIATYIGTETAGSEKDVALVGDYNMIPGQDNSNFMAMDPQDFLHYVSSEDLTFSHISSSGNPGNLLDGFAVSRTHTREYIAGTLRVLPMNRALGLSLLEYRQQVSDHLPVVARFRIVEDDD